MYLALVCCKVSLCRYYWLLEKALANRNRCWQHRRPWNERGERRKSKYWKVEASSIAKFPESYSQTLAEKTLNSSESYWRMQLSPWHSGDMGVNFLVKKSMLTEPKALKQKGRKKEEQISESGSQFHFEIPIEHWMENSKFA